MVNIDTITQIWEEYIGKKCNKSKMQELMSKLFE